MKNYIFDVDGTLTPSRGTMDPKFKRWFLRFTERYPVSFVTGSDLEKTVEQVGEDLVDAVRYSFNCSGNAIYVKRECIYQTDWKLPDDAWKFLETKLLESSYPEKYGKHFEQRIGMLNFSIVGRNAVGDQRTNYYNWDQINNERMQIAEEINHHWPDLQAAVGGETGIDIFARGCDKAQVLKYFDKDLVFIGDRQDPAGNDYTLAKAIIDKQIGWCYNVKNWTHTWNTLKQLCPDV